MGIQKNRHGTYVVRKKVPSGLQRAVAEVLRNRKDRQTFLQRSLDTKDHAIAKRKAPKVLIEFDSVLERARELAAGQPIRSTLKPGEIEQIAQHFHARELARDEAWRFGGRAYLQEAIDWVRRNEPDEGVELEPFVPLDSLPERGLSKQQLEMRAAELVESIKLARECLALGDISLITDELDVLLADLNIELDPNSAEYRQLGTEALRQHLRTLEAIKQRNEGEPVPTPKAPEIGTQSATGGGKLSEAFAGWQKARDPAPGTLAEYDRAIRLFTELHGDLPVVSIKRSHARTFREALQDVPRHRKGKLQKARLPELVEWRRENPDAQRLTEGTINKLLGGVQAIAQWGYDNGLVPDDVPWADPFARMRLEEDDPDREPFTVAELNTLFASPVFASGERPVGGKGEAAYWLPLLSLFTGARRGELAGLTVTDVAEDETVGWALSFSLDRKRGKTLKTKQSKRIVPLHSELKQLGFLDFVEELKRTEGTDAWLFKPISPQVKGGAKAWTKWFGRYLRDIGITDTRKVFHSFRHTFIDALRAAGISQEVKTALVGHAGDGSVHSDYGAKEMVRRFGKHLSRAVAAVKYPKLDLSHLTKHRTAERPKQRKSR